MIVNQEGRRRQGAPPQRHAAAELHLPTGTNPRPGLHLAVLFRDGKPVLLDYPIGRSAIISIGRSAGLFKRTAALADLIDWAAANLDDLPSCNGCRPPAILKIFHLYTTVPDLVEHAAHSIFLARHESFPKRDRVVGRARPDGTHLRTVGHLDAICVGDLKNIFQDFDGNRPGFAGWCRRFLENPPTELLIAADRQTLIAARKPPGHTPIKDSKKN
jgi:hypothetical protein